MIQKSLLWHSQFDVTHRVLFLDIFSETSVLLKLKSIIKKHVLNMKYKSKKKCGIKKKTFRILTVIFGDDLVGSSLS